MMDIYSSWDCEFQYGALAWRGACALWIPLSSLRLRVSASHRTVGSGCNLLAEEAASETLDCSGADAQ